MISPFIIGFLAGVFVTAVAVAIAIKADAASDQGLKAAEWRKSKREK